MPDSLTITREWMELLESLPTVQSRWNVIYAAARLAFDDKDTTKDLDATEKGVFMIIKTAIKNRKRVARCLTKKSARPLDSALDSNGDGNNDKSEVKPLDSALDSNGSSDDSDSLFNIEDSQEIFKQDNTIDSSKGLKKEKEIKSSTNSIMREKDKSLPEKRKIFVPPTLEDVTAYCQERRNAVNPEQFHAYYSSNGWMVGHGNKMKDWKSAVRYWEQRMYQERKKLSQKRDYSGI